MYLEYDWTFSVLRPRFGRVFTDIGGFRSFESLKEAKEVLKRYGMRVGKKTDTRTWEIKTA
jgi:hypothetical protein